MKKIIDFIFAGLVLVLLALSLFLLLVISVQNKHFLVMYYIVWVGVVGPLVWFNRVKLEEKLSAWGLSSFPKFLLLGIAMILSEEVLAGLSMNLHISKDPAFLIHGISQFWAFNLLALPGFIIAWHVLLSRYVYTKREVFMLVGIFGLFAEHVVEKVAGNPIAGALLILPTMFTYAIIIAPSLLSFRAVGERKELGFVKRYVFGFLVPVLVTLPFIAVLAYLKTHYPGAFPPEGFVG